MTGKEADFVVFPFSCSRVSQLDFVVEYVRARNPTMWQLSINEASRNNVTTMAADVNWLNTIIFLKHR
jgi:hypothetical protein